MVEQRARRADHAASRRAMRQWPRVFVYDLRPPLSDWSPQNATQEEVFGPTLNWTNENFLRFTGGRRIRFENTAWGTRETRTWWKDVPPQRLAELSRHVRNSNHYGFARARCCIVSGTRSVIGRSTPRRLTSSSCPSFLHRCAACRSPSTAQSTQGMSCPPHCLISLRQMHTGMFLCLQRSTTKAGLASAGGLTLVATFDTCSGYLTQRLCQTRRAQMSRTTNV